MTGAWVVFAVVVLLVAIAVLRRREHARRPDERRARGLILAGGAVAPAVVLTVLFVFSLRALPATSAPKSGTTKLAIEVVGHQWFWELRYPGTPAVTANEIHIPAGVPVRLTVRTEDVIHSLWVPRLNRKIDLVPGRRNEIVLEADEPGVYRGQCAEYCGLQHANMALLVYAEPPAKFRAWLAREASPARTATAKQERRGLRAFEEYGCGGCHTLRGTGADGAVGPDLTHLAARTTLAAATIPNSPAYLAGWIFDPQHVKPGNRMPAIDVRGDDFQALLDYLERLK